MEKSAQLVDFGIKNPKPLAICAAIWYNEGESIVTEGKTMPYYGFNFLWMFAKKQMDDEPRRAGSARAGFRGG